MGWEKEGRKKYDKEMLNEEGWRGIKGNTGAHDTKAMRLVTNMRVKGRERTVRARGPGSLLLPGASETAPVKSYHGSLNMS